MLSIIMFRAEISWHYHKDYIDIGEKARYFYTFLFKIPPDNLKVIRETFKKPNHLNFINGKSNNNCLSRMKKKRITKHWISGMKTMKTRDK